jgi:hypothetical protein
MKSGVWSPSKILVCLKRENNGRNKRKCYFERGLAVMKTASQKYIKRQIQKADNISKVSSQIYRHKPTQITRQTQITRMIQYHKYCHVCTKFNISNIYFLFVSNLINIRYVLKFKLLPFHKPVLSVIYKYRQ